MRRELKVRQVRRAIINVTNKNLMRRELKAAEAATDTALQSEIGIS